MSKPIKPATSVTEVDEGQLAQDIVESWDMDTLISFAVDTLEQNFNHMPQEDLLEEYNNFYFPKD